LRVARLASKVGGMFAVDEADAAAIRLVFIEEGELFAIVELRRWFPWCRPWSEGE